jgi:ribosome maturation factor RimP
MKLSPEILEIIERVTNRAGVELVHAEMTGGRNAVLRVYIDKPDGVTLDDCAAVSEQLSLILDVDDLIPHQYLLEVSSPGLDRGLEKPADYERFAGLRAHVKLSAPLGGQRNFRGTLVGLDRDGGLAALLDDETGKRHRLPLEHIAKAHVEIEPRRK